MATRPMRLRLSAGVQDAARRVPALGSLIERSLKTHLFVFQRQGGVFSYDSTLYIAPNVSLVIETNPKSRTTRVRFGSETNPRYPTVRPARRR